MTEEKIKKEVLNYLNKDPAFGHILLQIRKIQIQLDDFYKLQKDLPDLLRKLLDLRVQENEYLRSLFK